MGIPRTAQIDDDGTTTTGTVFNNAWKQALYDEIDAAFAANGGVVQTTTLTGTQHNFSLTAGVSLLRANNASALVLTGLAAGTPGQRVLLRSVGAGAVAIANDDAGSTAANRILTGTLGTLTLLAGSGTLGLVYDGTASRWIATSSPGVGQLRCAVFNSTTQSVNNATVTAITFDSEDEDAAAFHSTVTNTSRLTIPPGGDGRYTVIGAVTLASTAGTVRQVYLALNGTAFDEIQFLPTALARPQIISSVKAVAGDYLELQVFQDSGSAMNVGSGSAAFTNRLTAIKVG